MRIPSAGRMRSMLPHPIDPKRLESLWQAVPESVRRRAPVRGFANWLYARTLQQTRTPEATYTRFLRNRPQFETLADLAAASGAEPLQFAVFGCSTGAELYSILFAVRTRCPDRDVVAVGIDIAADVVEKAAGGFYAADDRELDQLTDAERTALFTAERGGVRVVDSLRRGVRWVVQDAGDPMLGTTIGLQHIATANNFLVHMDDRSAERCVRNIAGLVEPGGYISVWGMNLDLRERVARELAWEPVLSRIAEIHDADLRAREVWPWRYWGLEPLDASRPGWELRYATIFRVPDGPDAAPISRDRRGRTPTTW